MPFRNLENLARLCILIAIGSLGGCRLYEPPRYPRLQLPPTAERIRVLFVGNSMTFYNDLPGLVQQLSAREERPLDVHSDTSPYVSLEWHWQTGQAQALLANDQWDVVVLQDFSRRPVTDPGNSEKYFGLFAAAARRAGAKPLLFQNWTRVGRAGEYDAMLDTYRAVQQQTGAALAPVGLAWQLCARKHPEIPLFLDDRHPTDQGTYVAACVLYGAIYGKDPTSLPTDLAGPRLPPAQIQALREIAAEALHLGTR